MNRLLIGILGVLFFSCSTLQKTKGDDGKISVNFLLINDVYEIAPLSGGKEGGMARVATLKKSYLRQNPNTYLLVAGDFLSPSVFNSMVYEGQLVRGKQMIEAMNAAGVDLAVFGNHEFDIKENELLQRLNESSFNWISSNTFHKTSKGIEPFKKNGKEIPETYILNVQDEDGTRARIGFIGLCLPFNKTNFVHYEDALAKAKTLYLQLKDSVDAVVALTHQNMEEDIVLARELPQLAMILGGHEHDQRSAWINKVPIVKSMSNAKTSFVANLEINKKEKRFHTNIHLDTLNEKIKLDSQTTAVVKKWNSIIENSFSSLGFQLNRIVLEKGEPLEGREGIIRRQQTNLGQLITACMLKAFPGSRIAILNSGAIKVDDVLSMPLTEYDIIRTLPYGGGIKEIEVKGDLLLKTLDQGRRNAGSGGYLLYNAELKFIHDTWQLEGKDIEPSGTYKIVLSDFLLEGRETNLGFLNENNPGVLKVYPSPPPQSRQADLRLIIIDQLKNF